MWKRIWQKQTKKEGRPINRIQIRDEQVLEISVNSGWEITDVAFDDAVPASQIDKLAVTFERRG